MVDKSSLMGCSLQFNMLKMFSFSFNCGHQSSFKVTPHSLQGSRVDFFNHRFYPLSELCQIFRHWGGVYFCFDKAPKVKVKWSKVWWPRWHVDQGGVFIRSAADPFVGQTLVQEVWGNQDPDQLATAVTRPYSTWLLPLGLHQNKSIHLPNAKKSDTTQTKDKICDWRNHPCYPEESVG